MKFTITTDIEWLEDDGSIDDVLKQEIIRGISSKINTKSKEEIVKAVEKEISDKTENIIDREITKILKQFIKKGVTVTDQWGDVKEEIVVKDLIKKKFDTFMSEKVGDGGKTSNYGNQSRVDWIIDERVKEYCKKRTDEMVKGVEERIKEIFTDELEVKIKDKIVKQIGLEDLMSSAKRLTVNKN